jgi:hypothetical protein
MISLIYRFAIASTRQIAIFNGINNYLDVVAKAWPLWKRTKWRILRFTRCRQYLHFMIYQIAPPQCRINWPIVQLGECAATFCIVTFHPVPPNTLMKNQRQADQG